MTVKIPLREYIDQRIDAVEKLSQQSLVSQKDAVAIALAAIDERLLLHNGLQAAMATQAASFARTDTVEARLAGLVAKIDDGHEVLVEKIGANVAEINKIRDRGAGLNAAWGYVVAIVGVGLAVAGFFARHQ